MLKAVFFDIDGTLVSFNTHRVSDSSIAAIEKLKEKGIKVFIATGRPFFAIDNLGDLKFDAYVTLNGGCCLNAQHEVIYKKQIDRADIKALVDYINKKHSFPCVFVREKDSFANCLNETAIDVFKTINISLEKMGQILPLEHALENEILQLISFVDVEEEKSLLPFLPNCSSARWSPYFADIVSSGVSKRLGIDKILEEYNISLSETMAFGDGGNDISMLKHVNVGIAMGNAKEDVKQSADYVTTSVDDDGIWNALKHFNVI